MADEPFIMMSLKGDKAKKLANVLTNKSSAKILSFLANHEGATETDIAKELKIPISTVNYNMRALVEAKLVIDDEYHYSSRGKEVNHYKLARKYIIIAPEEEEEGFWERVKKYVPIALLAAGTGIVVKFLGFFTGTFAKAGSMSAMSDSIPLSDFAQESARAAPEVVGAGGGILGAEAPLAAEAGARAMDAAPELMKAAFDDGAQELATNTLATNITNTTQTISPPPAELYRPPVEHVTEPNLFHVITHDWLGMFLIGVFVFILMAMLVEAIRTRKTKKKAKK